MVWWERKGGVFLETHENIKALREKNGLSQEALAEKVGYKDRSTIAKIEAGLVDLSQSKIAAFAKAFSVTPAYLMGITDDTAASLPNNVVSISKMSKVPLIGQIACGEPILAEENIEDYVDLPRHIRADFALTCRGDSMINAGIREGDVVYIRKQERVENGQIAAVLIDDEATLKRFYYDGDSIRLIAENPSFPTKIYVGEEMNCVHIIGLAVGYTHALEA